MTRPCPRCARPNAAHRATCLYCGEALPNPAPPPEAPRARVLPADLDRLVNEALRGKGVKALHEALRQADTTPETGVASILATDVTGPGAGPKVELVASGGAVDATGVTAGESADVALGVAGDVASGVAGDVALKDEEDVTLSPSVDPAAQLLSALTEAEEAVSRARSRLTDGALVEAAEILRQLAGRLPTLLPEPAVEPTVEAPETSAGETSPVPLPLFRFGWALVIDGLADAARAPALASALGQDLATARLHAVSAHPKVVQRGDDEAALLARAERLRAEAVPTSVLHRSMVQRLGRPALARSFVWGGPVRGLDGRAFWEGDPEEVRAQRGAPWPWFEPILGVLGEVTVVRSRSAAAPGRFARKTLGVGPTVLDERRIGVLDLWGEDGQHLRLVEGLTDSGDSRAPFRALVETITAAASGLKLTARRVCRPEESRAAGEPGEAVVRSGWPTFEEHTRLCWLHHQAR